MATFYWNNGPSSGSLITMHLTIVGEVSVLHVTSSPATMGGAQPVPVTDFHKCVPFQTVECGPVPVQFLPLTANGLGCDGGSQLPVPSATSASPLDPTGPGPFCDALTAGGTFTYTQPGGTAQPGGAPAGAPSGGDTPMAACDAAQHSSQLDLARNLFYSACQLLRFDQASVSAYSAAAGVAAALAGGLVAAAAASGNIYTLIAFAIAAAVAAAVALIFLALALAAAANVSRDQQILASAQTAWRNAIASVRRACCPAWIVISTDDLVCP